MVWLQTAVPAYNVLAPVTAFGAMGAKLEVCRLSVHVIWSASPYAGNVSNAWNVNFNNGNDNINNKTNNHHVRLVRGGA